MLERNSCSLLNKRTFSSSVSHQFFAKKIKQYTQIKNKKVDKELIEIQQWRGTSGVSTYCNSLLRFNAKDGSQRSLHQLGWNLNLTFKLRKRGRLEFHVLN